MALFTRSELEKILDGKILQQGNCVKFSDVSIDSRMVKKNGIFIAIHGANLDGHRFVSQAIKNGARAVVVSKRISVRSKDALVIYVKDTTKALGELARAHRMRFSIPIIAVTGSAGKTTTKDLIAHILKTRYRVLKNQGSFNNHWGVPLTLLKLSSRYDAAVVEAGTNHPGEIAYLSGIIRPTIVVLTNVGLAHLKGLKTLQNIFKEKRSIIKGMMPGGVVVFNADDRLLRSLKTLKKKMVSYAVTQRADIVAKNIKLETSGKVSFKINGRHQVVMNTPVKENILNTLAAVVCARLLKISYNDVCGALVKKRFEGNRQRVKRVKRITIIDDSYNANLVSFKSALNTLACFPSKGKRILVCGDMLELGSQAAKLHCDLANDVVAAGVDCVFTLGSLMKQFGKSIVRRGLAKVQVSSYDNMTRLTDALGKNILAGDVILVKGSRGMKMERVVEFLCRGKVCPPKGEISLEADRAPMKT